MKTWELVVRGDYGVGDPLVTKKVTEEEGRKVLSWVEHFDSENTTGVVDLQDPDGDMIESAMVPAPQGVQLLREAFDSAGVSW